MSLMRLLSVSRSFCSNVPEMGRYKLSRRRALPDFRRPGEEEPRGRRATQGEFAMNAAAPRVRESRGQGSLALGPEPVGRGEGDHGVAGPVVSIAARPAELEPETQRTRAGGWGDWLGGLARGWSGWRIWPQAKPKRRPGRLPVQTAFSLETVRVVRNDLTEADVELVILKAKRGGATAGVKGRNVVKAADGETGRPLARMAAKLFSPGRSS